MIIKSFTSTGDDHGGAPKNLSQSKSFWEEERSAGPVEGRKHS